MLASQESALSISTVGKVSLMFLGAMCVLPFLFPHHMPPISSFYNEWLAAVLALLSVLLLVRKTKEPFIFPLIALLPFGLILILGIQIVLGKAIYWQNHYLVMLYMGLSMLMMLYGANIKQQFGLSRIATLLSWALVCGGSVLLILLILAKLGFADKPVWSIFINDTKASNLGQINHFANYLGLATASLLYLHVAGRIKSYVFVLFSFAFIFGLAYTGQRMAILYLLVLSVGAWWLIRRLSLSDYKQKSKQSLWFIPMYVLAELAFAFTSVVGDVATPISRVADTISGNSVRLDYLEQAWQLFSQHKLLGAGWGEFSWFNYTVTENYPAQQGLTHHAHNIVFQFLAELGLLGAGLLITTLFIWTAIFFRAELTLERCWIILLLSILGIHSLLEFPLWYAYFLCIAAVLFGLGEEQLLKLNLRFTPLLFAAILVFGGWTLGNLFVHYNTLERTLTELREQKPSQYEAKPILMRLHEIRLLSPLTPHVDNLIVRILPNHPQLVEDKLEINQRVVRFWPGMVETYTHASLLAMNHKSDDAIIMLNKALKQFPRYSRTYSQTLLGQIMLGNTSLQPLYERVRQNSINSKTDPR